MFYVIPFARYLLPLALLHLVGTMLFQGMVPAAQIGFSYAVLVVVLAILAFLFVMGCVTILAYEEYRLGSSPVANPRHPLAFHQIRQPQEGPTAGRLREALIRPKT